MTWVALPAVLAVVAGLVVLLARRPLWAVAVVPLGAGVGPQALPGVPGNLNYAHVLVVVAVGAVLLSRLVLGDDRDWSRLRGAPAVAVGGTVVYGAAVAASALLSPFLSDYAGITITTLVGILYAGCVLFVTRTTADLRLLLTCTAIGSFGSTVPALLGGSQVRAQLAGAVVSGRAVGSFADPNELGFYTAVTFFLSITLAVATERRSQRLVGIAASLACGAALVLSFSRLSWLAFTLGVVVLLFNRTFRRLIVARVVPAVVVPLLLAQAAGVALPFSTVVARVSSLDGAVNPDDTRPEIWSEALRYFWERPLLGWGPGAYRSLNASPPSPIWANPVEHGHDGLLTTLAEEGAIGGVAVVVVAVALGLGLDRVRRARRKRRGTFGEEVRTDLLAYGLGTTAGVVLANLTVDYALRNAYVLVFVAMVAGLVAALGLVPPPTTDRRPGGRRPAGREPAPTSRGTT
ncbi:O-antigen ligase family protein [Nocardioides marmoribigeumensis]|uniref:O-antigen ligase n=1 Tax=Nocardioides marmoribigeumensis TaxID=433649 RepID=A0ABU2BZK1_9ACTN|nr:O-antigen ligase family protein [Nocardioides marmoribigeumensis]MDR7363814.1 O-antigen ligase [Nocardioides marmoribigeumensis]